MNDINNESENDVTLTEALQDILAHDNIDISLDDIKNLLKLAPSIKEMILKITDSTFSTSNKVLDLLKQTIQIYEGELKREDLSQEQRESIYERIDTHAKNALEHDDKNKKFIAGLTGVALTAMVGTAVKFGPNIIKSIIRK